MRSDLILKLNGILCLVPTYINKKYIIKKNLNRLYLSNLYTYVIIYIFKTVHREISKN